MPRLTGISTNLAAALDTIADSEGTAGIGDDGYNALFGASSARLLLFPSYSTHPNIRSAFRTKKGILDWSTAAGRYQLINRWYAPYAKLLKLSDFSPESQDKIAIQQIKEQKGLDPILSGDFDEFVNRCRNIWASFAGAGYDQKEHSIEWLRDRYVKHGGLLGNVKEAS